MLDPEPSSPTPFDPTPYRMAEGLSALKRGWRVIPLRGKNPVHLNWPSLQPPTDSDVTRWASQHNLGICTGTVSGLVVIDEQIHLGGSAASLHLPKTPTVMTGQGGQHYYYLCSKRTRDTTSIIAPNVDTRGDGGWAVSAGSVHPITGKTYTWVEGLSPDDVPFAALPEAIEAAILDSGPTLDASEETPVIIHPSSNEKPSVLIAGAHATTSDYQEVSNAAFGDEVLSNIPKGVLYRMGSQGSLIGILSRGDDQRLSFYELSESDWCCVIDEHVKLIRWRTPAKGTPETVYHPCTPADARLVRSRARSHQNIRHLRLVSSYPVCSGAAFHLIEAGWNEEPGIYYDCAEALAPIRDSAVIAGILSDLTIDFPFHSDDDRQNFYGLLLTPILRPAIDGNVPMHLVHTSGARVGKTKLVEDVLGYTILGRFIAPIRLSDDEAELDKRILSMLLSGETIIHLDNLGDHIDSAALASLLTATSYQSRILGKSQNVSVRNALTIVATGNNVRMSKDLAHRTVSIELIKTTENPEERTDFKHEEIRAYVQEPGTRNRVLSALVGMVLNWQAEDRPSWPIPFGGFERWGKVIGGILSANGFGRHRMNRYAWLEKADTTTEELRTFVTCWAERAEFTGYRSNLWRTSQLVEIAKDNDTFGTILSRATKEGSSTSFGMRVLSRFEDEPIAGFRIKRLAQKGHPSQWFLERM